MEACVHPKSQQKTQGLLFYLREKNEDFSLFFFFSSDSRAEVTVSLKEELFCFLKK